MILKSEDFGIIESNDLSLNIQKNGNYLHIQGSNSVGYEAMCDRCAEEYKTGLIVNIDYFFHIGDIKSANSADLEIIYPEENDNNLDLVGYYRESFFLAQPLRFLCRENCKGLCQKCGADLNKIQCGCTEDEKTDPRWEKLTELLKKK